MSLPETNNNNNNVDNNNGQGNVLVYETPLSDGTARCQ